MLSTDIAWRPADLEDTSRWVHVLTDAEITDLDAALAHARREGFTLGTLTKDAFPLNTMLPTLEKVLGRIENDLGVFVLRGLPIQRYTKEHLRLLYWGMGLHMGTAVTQSHKGEVLADVRDLAGETSVTDLGRGYMSNENLGFHTDTCDVVCLFVLQTAKSGGLSTFCSSVAIRDKIASTWPYLHDVLQRPFYWHWKGSQPPGAPEYYPQPIYSYADGRFSSRYIKTHIFSAQKVPDVPRLTELQRMAMSAIDLLANDPDYHYAMMFEPGDMQFLNNHITYHARTGFEDWPEPERRRHLLRLWLAPPNSRRLSDEMTAIYQDPSPGATRGGFPAYDRARVFETVLADA
jgi:hypothetical protein